MTWVILWILAGVLGIALLALVSRRSELAGMARGLERLDEAKSTGRHQAKLQHPHIDLSRCIGCGICVRACPEDEVLDLVHGQAVVVHGARCVGHGLCAVDCPVDAIALTLGDVSERRDLPAITDRFEAVGIDGLFLEVAVDRATAKSDGTNSLPVADAPELLDVVQRIREAAR